MTVGHFIAGQWWPGRDDALSENPARPAEEIVRHALATDAEVDAAVEAADAALPAWIRTPAPARAAILRRAGERVAARAEELARLLTREEGKPLAEARGEVHRAALIFHYHAAQAWRATGEVYASSNPDEEIRTVRVPVGVVAAITPWNFPIAIPAWKIAPALVHGNTIVWKPASPTPAMAVELARELEAAGLPAGVLNLVLGSGRAGARLVSHKRVDAITFTGSGAVGRGIWNEATPRGVRVQLELGGHNAAIVYPDADLDRAVDQIVIGAMGATGQKCTATRRIVAVGGVHDALVERLTERVAALRVGDALDESVDVGPLVSAAARDEVADEVARAARDGVEIAAGGDVVGLDGGYYLRPTLLTDVTPDMRIAQEEVFGPVTSVIHAADDDEAIAIANATRFGLSAAVFTRDERRIRRALHEIDAGIIHVNNATTGSEPHVPFGGMRESSSQGPHEQGETARDFFTELKTAYLVPGDAAP